MRRRRLALRLLALACALAALAPLRSALFRPAASTGAPFDDGTSRVRGVVHVHTTASDGGGTPEEVVAAAQQAGLDFLFITDHNTLEAKRLEGRHGRLLVGVGTEISTSAGHLLALGVSAPAFRFWGDPRAALDDVRALGGAAFVAHGDSPRPDLRWTAWDLRGPWGVEVYNADSQWRAAGAWRGLRALLAYPGGADWALLSSLTAPDASLGRWDGLLTSRPVAMIAGADAHGRVGLGRARGDDGRPARGPSLRFPAYAALFRQARNHVLLDAPLSGDAAVDLRRIALALARGRSYAALDALAAGDGFGFAAESGGRRGLPGDELPFAAGARLRAGGRVPAGAVVVLLRDGVEVARGDGAVAHVAAAPGVYRVEVRVGGWPFPWVISNPIALFDEATLARRAAAAAWPAETAAPVPSRLIDAFEGASVFHPELDPSSSLVQPFVVDAAGEPSSASAGVGPAGSGLARLAFRLGAPSPGGPAHPWVALMSRAQRDLTGTRGLVLSVKADGVYRFALVARDPNPRGSDDGHESFLASVRTSTEWRRVALPWESFRSLDPNGDGRLDLARVAVLGLVIDDLALPPGTRGTLWLDELGVY